jgi:tryptophan halogenase
MNKKVDKICIVGTGSAGWITALTLKINLPEVEIVIIDSKKYSNIGVGESTQPGLVTRLEEAGIDPYDFMKETEATLKHGIYYTDWNEIGKDYWHPFSHMTASGNYTAAHHYALMSSIDPVKYPPEKYHKAVHSTYTLCVENNLSSNALPYALHIDADLLAKYLKKFLKDRINVLEIESGVDVVTDKENNQISHLVADGEKVEADLYVDCTGFKRVLISKLEGLVEDNYEGNVNSALFVRPEYGHERVKPIAYTEAAAWENGWVWTIPLGHRVGSGCVYHKDFCTTEEAKAHFVKFWEGAITEDDIRGPIHFSSSCLKNPWINNVVAIGLSSGFVEPLEATGIEWFVTASNNLAKFLHNRFYQEEDIYKYNGDIRSFVNDVQDFIDVHYMLSERRDSDFWKYQTSRKRSDRLLTRLEVYKEYMPNKNNRNRFSSWSFNDVSWLDILAGYKFKYNPDLALYKGQNELLWKDKELMIKV